MKPSAGPRIRTPIVMAKMIWLVVYNNYIGGLVPKYNGDSLLATLSSIYGIPKV